MPHKPSSLVREREGEKERDGERGRERELARTLASIQHAHTLSVPHSVSQTVSMRDYYINYLLLTIPHGKELKVLSFRHHDSTYKDFSYNINKCNITYIIFI